jgi:hypothetical protein
MGLLHELVSKTKDKHTQMRMLTCLGQIHPIPTPIKCSCGRASRTTPDFDTPCEMQHMISHTQPRLEARLTYTLSVIALAVLGRLELSVPSPASRSKKSDHRSARFSLLPDTSAFKDAVLGLRNGDIGTRSAEDVEDAPGRARPVCSFCSISLLDSFGPSYTPATHHRTIQAVLLLAEESGIVLGLSDPEL